MEKEEKLTREFKITITSPLLVKDVPAHLTMDYIMKSLPYLLGNTFNGEAEIKIEEITVTKN